VQEPPRNRRVTPYPVMAQALRRVRAMYRRALPDHVDLLLRGKDDADGFEEWYARVWPVLWWDHRPTARRLYRLARNGPGKGAIVEIGSDLGNSTIYLAAADRDHVHAVDPHDEGSMTQVPFDDTVSEQFQRNLQRFGVQSRVAYHRCTSFGSSLTMDRRSGPAAVH
jgi:predicted O-methyltransferase YrrM